MVIKMEETRVQNTNTVHGINTFRSKECIVYDINVQNCTRGDGLNDF